MADRHDIDALLVDAVYREREGGHEPDGADRARLDAYLASHPHERAALDAMKHTRARVQEARLGLPDAEPSAAVSALLLQEAARRAPARARGGQPTGGVLAWLSGALRPMFAHPALASAAALVLVGGTAGALYLRSGSALYEPTASPAVEPAAAAPEIARAEPVPGDTFAATLDEVQAADLGAGKNAAGLPDVTATLTGSGDPAAAEVRTRAVEQALRESAGAPVTVQVPRQDRGRGALARSLDVTTTDPELKELDDDAFAGARAQKAAPKPTAPAPKQEAEKKGDAAGADRLASAPAAEPAPAPAPVAAAAAPSTARYDASREEERAAWARGQHQRAVAAVKRNDCNEAAALAAEIAVRAADYYAASVSDDRNLRPCKPAIERARKRDAERRAKSRAPAANDAPDANDAAKVPVETRK
jgi:hypothetical protein